MRVRTRIPEDHCSSRRSPIRRIVRRLFTANGFTPSNNVCHGPRGRKGDLPAIPEGSIVRPPIVSGISRERARPATMGNDWLTGVRVMRILAIRKRGSRMPRIFKSRGFTGRVRAIVVPFIAAARARSSGINFSRVMGVPQRGELLDSTRQISRYRLPSIRVITTHTTIRRRVSFGEHLLQINNISFAPTVHTFYKTK